jgi:hypothetical protein
MVKGSDTKVETAAVQSYCYCTAGGTVAQELTARSCVPVRLIASCNERRRDLAVGLRGEKRENLLVGQPSPHEGRPTSLLRDIEAKYHSDSSPECVGQNVRHIRITSGQKSL